LGGSLKLKKYHKLIVASDGGAASGKTTGARLISKKYGLKFLSSGLLYRYASYQLLKYKPKDTIFYLKKCFHNLSLKKLNNKNLHLPEISAYSSIIAKKKKIRNILQTFQKKFAKKHSKVCIEGRDIGTVILPHADIKFFFKCSLEVAAKRRFKELRKKKKHISFAEVKKDMRIRNNADTMRRNSPLIQAKNAVIVQTDKLKTIKGMLNKMSEVIEENIKRKYGS
jgi:cytidylate kinase